jgi:hypothetical protein
MPSRMPVKNTTPRVGRVSSRLPDAGFALRFLACGCFAGFDERKEILGR